MAEEKKVVKPVDVVSQDRNWVLRINSELDSEKRWDSEFGYLSKGKMHCDSGFSPERTNIKPSIDDKIKELERVIHK